MSRRPKRSFGREFKLQIVRQLARMHPYRNQPNSEFPSIALDLVELMFHFDTPQMGDVGRGFARNIGRGDLDPLLDLPGLS